MANDNKVVLGGDTRLRKDAGADSRGSRESADNYRETTDGTSTSTTERLLNFRDEWTANALPNPPALPGYHLCWLSTTNNADPIHKRIRMGYEPVRAEEVPGFEHYKMKSGEYEGVVSCNEMVLFKLPEDIHREMMSYFHHEKPLQEEEMLKENPALRDPNAQKLVSGDEDGFANIGRRR